MLGLKRALIGSNYARFATGFCNCDEFPLEFRSHFTYPWIAQDPCQA